MTASKHIPRPKSSLSKQSTRQDDEKPKSRDSSIEHISSPVLNRKITIVKKSRSADTTPTREMQRRASPSSARSDNSPIKSSYPRRHLAESSPKPNRSMIEYTPQTSPARFARKSLSPKPLTFKARQAITRIDMIKVNR